MLSIKIPHKLLEKFELQVMCRGILDEYNADPVKPGSGRMFYFDGGVEL